MVIDEACGEHVGQRLKARERVGHAPIVGILERDDQAPFRAHRMDFDSRQLLELGAKRLGPVRVGMKQEAADIDGSSHARAFDGAGMSRL
jgi:hypothetical protein